jgi:hypothetical protein
MLIMLAESRSLRRKLVRHPVDAGEDFVAMRKQRDATLQMPKLIIPSVQINMRAGQLPPAEDNGVTYLKVPVNLL